MLHIRLERIGAAPGADHDALGEIANARGTERKESASRTGSCCFGLRDDALYIACPNAEGAGDLADADALFA